MTSAFRGCTQMGTDSNVVTKDADSLYGGHESVDDSNFEHYRYNGGALAMGFYEKNGRNVLWISRAND